LIKYVIR